VSGRKCLRRSVAARSGALAAVAVLLLVLTPWAREAAAQNEASRCDEANAGRMQVQAGVRCACVHAREGGIAQIPSGWRWDCGILRPRNNADVGVSDEGYEAPLPSSVYIEEGWHEAPEEHERDHRLERPHGPRQDVPTFHDRARNRSRPGDRPGRPGRMSPPVDR
jgi:hypothetical protein